MEVLSDVIAVPDRGDGAGSVTWWRLSGDVDVGHLAESWAKRGLPPSWLPRPPSAVQALRRALDEVLHRSDLVVKALRGPGNYAVVLEKAGAEQFDAVQLARVTLLKDDQGADVVSVDTSASWGAPEDALESALPDRLATLRSTFDRCRAALAPEDVSSWVLLVLDKLSAITLRPLGGVYFVPRHSADGWASVASALEEVSCHRVFSLPAMRSDEAVEAILDALQRETEAAVRAVEGELVEEDLGERALRRRVAEMTARAEKLESYAGLLGRNLGGITDKVDRLHTQLTVAMLSAASRDGDA